MCLSIKSKGWVLKVPLLSRRCVLRHRQATKAGAGRGWCWGWPAKVSWLLSLSLVSRASVTGAWSRAAAPTSPKRCSSGSSAPCTRWPDEWVLACGSVGTGTLPPLLFRLAEAGQGGGALDGGPAGWGPRSPAWGPAGVTEAGEAPAPRHLGGSEGGSASLAQGPLQGRIPCSSSPPEGGRCVETWLTEEPAERVREALSAR